MREITTYRSLDSYVPLKKELEKLAEGGISLTLEGRESTPALIAKRCVFSEDCNYMRDYVADKEGKIVKVDFTRISLGEP